MKLLKKIEWASQDEAGGQKDSRPVFPAWYNSFGPTTSRIGYACCPLYIGITVLLKYVNKFNVLTGFMSGYFTLHLAIVRWGKRRMKKTTWRPVSTLTPGHNGMKSEWIDRINEENDSE